MNETTRWRGTDFLRGLFRGAMMIALLESTVIAQECGCPGGLLDFAVDPIRQFGEAVAIDPPHALVGEPGGQSPDPGRVLVFGGAGEVWNPVAILTRDAGVSDDEFGAAIVIDDTTVFVGAPIADGHGSVSIFEGAGASWKKIAELTSLDIAPGDRFGAAVALDGDRLVVSADRDDDLGTDSGSVYVFERAPGPAGAWVQQAKITTPELIAGNRFGLSIDIHQDLLIVGSHSGGAFIFRKGEGPGGAWTRIVQLRPDHQRIFHADSVAIHGEFAAVGNVNDDERGRLSGAVFVFRRDDDGADQWGEVAKLLSTVAEVDPFRRFGASLDIDDDRLVVGARGRGDGSDRHGYAAVFRADGSPEQPWRLESRFDGGNEYADEFGAGVSMHEGVLLAGAPSHGEPYSGDGAAFAFDVDGCLAGVPDCNGNGIRDACDIFGGVSADCNDNGIPDECDIAAGTSEDCCCVNGVPDECEADCNGNGAPDACDIADGISSDLNENGVADECEPYRVGCEQILTAAEPGDGVAFGSDIEIEGDTMVVGAPGADGAAPGSGAAFVHRRVNGMWVLEAELVASDGAAGDLFGRAVGLSGDWAIVGAPGADDETGVVYLFERLDAFSAKWVERRTLTGSDRMPGDEFGFDAAIDVDVIMVGAPRHSFVGAAYFFERDAGGKGAWGEVRKQVGDSFAGGHLAVDVEGDRAAVGSPFEDSVGVAYVYGREVDGGWGRVQRILPSYTVCLNTGWDVDLDGDVLLVGAPSVQLCFQNVRPRVYVFGRNAGGPDNWGQTGEILSPVDGHRDLFGEAVARSGETILIGAPADDRLCPTDLFCDAGAVYLFDDDYGGPITLTALGPQSGARWGAVVALDGDSWAVGNPLRDEQATDDGAVFVFEDSRCVVCPGDVDGGGSVGFADILAVLVAWGPCPPDALCPEDVDGNGMVGFTDVLDILAAWGPCLPDR